MVICMFSSQVSSQSTSDDESETNPEQNISDKLVDPNDPFGDQRNGSASNNQLCQIVIVNPGILRPNIENYVLSSKEMGARAGTVQVSATNSSYSLSIDTPLGFTAMPTGGAKGVVMATSFSGSGATNFTETPGNNAIRLKPGTTLVEAHVSAKRSMKNPFPSGQYSTEITMRCE